MFQKKFFLIVILSLILALSSFNFDVSANTENFNRAKQLFDLSLQQFRRNNLREAIDLITRAIRLDNTNYVYYYNLGVYYLRLKNYDEAIDRFLNALKYQADHQESYYNIGLCYFYKADYVKAADYFKQAIGLNQYDIDAQINLGLAYKNLNQLEAAVIQYQKALMIDPDNTSALVNLAVVYKLRNELQKSVDLFNKVLSLEPDNTEALYNLNLLKDTIKKQQELTEKLEQPKQISQPAQVAQQHDAESISAQKTQSAPAAQWQLPTLKSDITGKEVSFPLDFKEPYTLETTVKMQLPEEIKPKLSLSSKSETQQPLKQDTIAITLTSNVPAELNEWQKFKSELVSDIKSELSNFLNDLKKILAPASYNVSQKSFGYDDFLFTDNFSTFNFQNNDLLGFSTKADNFDFLNTNDFNFTSVNDFNLSDNFDLSINNFENNNLSFDADGLINFTNLNPFEPELNSSTYWTDNSKSDIFSEAVRQSKPAVQSEQFDWLGIDNSSDFSELLDINELLNDLNQPLENSSFDINLGIDNLNQSTAVSAKNDLFDFTPLNLTDNFTISPAQQPLKTSANIQQTKSTNQSMININTDSEEVLMSKGLPADIVKNIIWYRSNITKFRMIEDFLTLPNVTQEIYNRFKDRIVF